jgi:hypothetical protein
MKIELDIEGNFLEATDFTFHRKESNTLLGIQRGVDVYFRFKSKDGRQLNERCFHFSSVGAPWSNEKCMEEVMKKLESGGIVKTEITYPPKTEEAV